MERQGRREGAGARPLRPRGRRQSTSPGTRRRPPSGSASSSGFAYITLGETSSTSLPAARFTVEVRTARRSTHGSSPARTAPGKEEDCSTFTRACASRSVPARRLRARPFDNRDRDRGQKVIGLARLAAPIACVGLAVLLAARTGQNRIAGLGYAAVGTALLVASAAASLEPRRDTGRARARGSDRRRARRSVRRSRWLSAASRGSSRTSGSRRYRSACTSSVTSSTPKDQGCSCRSTLSLQEPGSISLWELLDGRRAFARARARDEAARALPRLDRDLDDVDARHQDGRDRRPRLLLPLSVLALSVARLPWKPLSA